MELREQISKCILEHTDADTNDATFAATAILAIPELSRPLEPSDAMRTALIEGLIEANDRYDYDLCGNDFAAIANVILTSKRFLAALQHGEG